jgi:tetratricopeptide (TPR) repeat protein
MYTGVKKRMNRFHSVLLIITIQLLLFPGCKTLKYSDLQPNGSNPTKIPKLETQFDMASLRENMKFGKVYSNSNIPDVLAKDFSIIAKNDFQNNIVNNLSISTGIAECRVISGKNSSACGVWTIINAATAFVPAIVGIPISGRKSSLELEITIKNKNSEIIKIYSGTGNAKLSNGLYYGYKFNCIDRAVTNAAMINAMTIIKHQIGNDQELLTNELLKSLTKSELAKYEKDIEEAENARKSLLKDQKTKDSIRFAEAEHARQSLLKDQAIKDSIRFTEALRLYSLGNEKMEAKNYTGAINDFSKSILLKATNADVFNNRGFAYYNLGQYNKAIRDYKKCLKLNPADEDALSNKILAKQRKSERTMAILNATSAVLNATSATLNTIYGVPTSTTYTSPQSNITQNKLNENVNNIQQLKAEKSRLERQLVDVRLEIIKIEKDEDLAVIKGTYSASASYFMMMKSSKIKMKSDIERNIDICTSKINNLEALNP